MYTPDQQSALIIRLENGIGYTAELLVNALKNGSYAKSINDRLTTYCLWLSVLTSNTTTVTADQLNDVYIQADQCLGDFPGNEIIAQDIVLP